METEELAVHVVRRPPVVGQLLRRLGHRQGELVEISHRRHRASLPRRSRQPSRLTPGRRTLQVVSLNVPSQVGVASVPTCGPWRLGGGVFAAGGVTAWTEIAASRLLASYF